MIGATSKLGLLALLGLSLGCGSGEASSEPPRVVLGSGRLAFEPLESGASVPLIAGIQGGFHVWVSFLAYGFGTEPLHMGLSTRLDGLEESLRAPVRVAANPSNDAEGTPARLMLGWPAVLLDALCSNGRELEVNVDVTDDEGRAASDARRWILVVDEVDRSPDCPL